MKYLLHAIVDRSVGSVLPRSFYLYKYENLPWTENDQHITSETTSSSSLFHTKKSVVTPESATIRSWCLFPEPEPTPTPTTTTIPRTRRRRKPTRLLLLDHLPRIPRLMSWTWVFFRVHCFRKKTPQNNEPPRPMLLLLFLLVAKLLLLLLQVEATRIWISSSWSVGWNMSHCFKTHPYGYERWSPFTTTFKWHRYVVVLKPPEIEDPLFL